MKLERNIKQFDKDIQEGGQYAYTTERLSSVTANKVQTDLTVRYAGLKNRRVIDVGCGDGTYTASIMSSTGAKEIVGIDPAKVAIARAKKKYRSEKNLSFFVYSCYDLPYKDNEFDIAVVRGVLHHLDRPFKGLKEIVRVSRAVFIIEPNGYNPILKIIEKASPYHRAHDEKSYPPYRFRTWLKKLHCTIEHTSFNNVVPFFAPDFIVRPLLALNPVIEKIPLVRSLLCASYVIVVRKSAQK